MRVPGLLPRDHWVRHVETLDPAVDYEEISRITGHHEFPWDLQQALSFALFRTYAVPSIGSLLHRTDEFTGSTQKRHDDTVIVLETVLDDGMENPDGRAAIRRMNQMHGSYDISNDDMLYVLCTFVVAPVRWIDELGWRRLTETELRAAVEYYRRLGRLMGIRGIPDDYAGFERHMDRYEAAHFAPSVPAAGWSASSRRAGVRTTLGARTASAATRAGSWSSASGPSPPAAGPTTSPPRPPRVRRTGAVTFDPAGRLKG